MSWVMLVKSFLPEKWLLALSSVRAAVRDAILWRSFQRCPITPPPHIIKVRRILEYAQKHRIEILVETGTFLGETPRKCRRAFRRIYTIELDKRLAERASQRLSRYPHIHVICADSAEYLPVLLQASQSHAYFGWTVTFPGERPHAALVTHLYGRS